MGRWICDFRPLNRVTVKRPCVVGDVFNKTRALSSKLYKSGLDAWSGFNQLSATEEARKLLQLVTSRGLRQCVVLPFGVTNGPSYFQEFMLDLFGGWQLGQENLLNDSMKEQNANLEVFVDDIQLGTGDALADDPDNESSYVQHLDALSRVLKRARCVDLRYKLDKCHLVQLE